MDASETKYKMIDYKKEIVPFESIGGILLSENINNYITDLYKHCEVVVKEFNNGGVNFFTYSIDDCIVISTLEDGEIISIIANENYKGSYLNFHTGMTVKEIKKYADELNVMNGCLIINKNYGFAFLLPTPYNEIADYPKHLPDNLVLKEIFLFDFTWWYQPELTPDYAK